MPIEQTTPAVPGTPASWHAWRADPTPENMSAVLADLDPIVTSETQRYSGPKEVLYWKGKQFARDAVKSYDPAQGASLHTWVRTQMQPLHRYGQRLAPVRTPETVRRQGAELHAITERMHSDLGRLPTDEELADESGKSVAAIQKLRQRVGLTLAESQMVDTEGNAIPLAVSAARPADFASEAVYQGLSPHEQLIYDWKTGAHGREVISNKEIAQRLGVTPSSITQASQRISARIEEVSRNAI